MNESTDDLNRRMIQRRLTALIEELEAAERQRLSMLDEGMSLRLDRKAVQLIADIRALQTKLDDMQQAASKRLPMPSRLIEDVIIPTRDDIDHQLNLLAIHRRSLAHYLEQQALLGRAYTPPAVLNGIIEVRENIRHIKDILRNWNVSFGNAPDDEMSSGP